MVKQCFQLLFIGFIVSFLSCNQVQHHSTTPLGDQENASVATSIHLIDSSILKEAKVFCQQQKLDTNFAFFVDMDIHSGSNRFFVYNFTTRQVLHAGLCCHGMGGGSSASTPVFSNEKGSNCTSLGKYKLGARAYSNWGIHVHYKMHGLESTNTNAFSRIVVLHSYEQVPNYEIYPIHLPMGWSQGCPVISNELMTKLDDLLKNKKTPVLLWIYQ
jgi:hypothetical protein